jgi:hypothetical protein
VKDEGSEPQAPRARLVELGIGAAWLVGLAAAMQIVEQILGPANLGGVILSALAVDIAARRAGVRWDSPDRGLAPGKPDEATLDAPPSAIRRVAVGAAVAVLAGGLALAVAAGFRWCHLDAPAQLSPALAFALARAAAVSVRDELLFRGIPLAAASRAGVPAPVARAFAALVSGAALALVPGVTAGALALAIASGWLFAALWHADRGAWAAIGAHAAWALLLGSVLHGGLFDAEWTTGELALGASAGGPPAWVAAAILVVAAAAFPRVARKKSLPEASNQPL